MLTDKCFNHMDDNCNVQVEWLTEVSLYDNPFINCMTSLYINSTIHTHTHTHTHIYIYIYISLSEMIELFFYVYIYIVKRQPVNVQPLEIGSSTDIG